MIIYVVKPGDTLYEIARRYDVDLNRIVDDNQLDPNESLVIGQALVIRRDNFTYTVRQGDTLYSIANRFNVDVEDIIETNNLDTDQLRVGQELEIRYDNPNKVPLEINGYVYANVDLEELSKVLPYLTYLAIFSYQIKSDGSLTTLNEEPLIREAYRYQVAPIMVITNIDKPGQFSSELASTIINSPQLTDKLLNNIIRIAKTKGYYGVDFDFEYLFPEDRETYNNFLRRARELLHNEGLTISTAIAPKLSQDQVGILYEAHDYSAHGEIVDRVIIMTYEWGYIHSEAMPVAPINMVERVIQYAITEIPSGKILMGVPNYGYVFDVPKIPDVPARLITNNEAIEIARKNNAAIQFCKESMSPFFQYYENGKLKEVHFEDARSIEEKVNLAIDYNLGGLSYWTVMSFFKPNWLVVENFADIVKVIGEREDRI